MVVVLHIILLVAGIWRSLLAKSLDSPENSIMELINMDRVEKLLAERRLNSSKVGPTPDYNTLAEDHMDDNLDLIGNTVLKGKKGIPDLSTILSEIHKNKLKTDDTGVTVSKKEFFRKDWCRTEPYIQKIREEGCQPKNVVNRFCYGQCNSFYIPKNLSTKKGRRKKDDLDEGPTFKSSGACKPKRTAWVQVTLNCPGQNPPLRRRRVQKIRQCQCMAENVF